MISVSFSICCFIFIVIFNIVYFSKTRIDLLENKIYTCLLITTLIGLTIDIIGFFSFKTISLDSFINLFISKIYLIYYFTWTCLLTIYTLIISFKKKIKKILKPKIILFIYFLFSILILVLPTYINYEIDAVFSYGPSVNLLYLLSAICVLIMILSIIINIKNAKRKEYIPLLTFIVFSSVVLVIQHQYPNLLLLITCQSIVTCLMYFTIENPDMQMVEELTKNRKLTEENFEEKSNFLFKVSQDLKNPLKEITILSEKIINNNNIEENAKKINLNSRQLYTYVNNGLDVSQIDIKNLKVFESIYNSNNFFDEINRRVNTEIKNQNKNIEYRVDITKNLPLYLSGDNTKLKQIILSILFNSIKHTNDFVELSVNAITKYGVCRLLIEISDSGEGMSLDKINRILSANEELTKDEIDKIDTLNIDLVLVHKMLEVLNGNFLIKSEKSVGTRFLIIIDQKIEEKKIIKKDYSKVNNKILLISDNDELKNIVKNKLNDIDVEQSLYVKDALEKISEKKIKCILIDDKLNEMNPLGILKELNTDIPTIILIGESEKFLGKHYVEDGFNSFMIKEYIEDELDKINRYI